MRVNEVMTEGVKTVSPSATAEEAWNLMKLNGIHHLVVTEGGAVRGVLSERDAGGRRGGAVRANRLVADLMTAPAVTVEPTATVRQAANLMRGRSIGCLVAVKGARVAGIVTVADLLQLLGRGFDRGAVTTERPVLRHRAPHRKSKGAATGVW